MKSTSYIVTESAMGAAISLTEGEEITLTDDDLSSELERVGYIVKMKRGLTLAQAKMIAAEKVQDAALAAKKSEAARIEIEREKALKSAEKALSEKIAAAVADATRDDEVKIAAAVADAETALAGKIAAAVADATKDDEVKIAAALAEAASPPA